MFRILQDGSTVKSSHKTLDAAIRTARRMKNEEKRVSGHWIISQYAIFEETPENDQNGIHGFVNGKHTFTTWDADQARELADLHGGAELIRGRTVYYV